MLTIEKVRNLILILLLIVAGFVANSCAPVPTYANTNAVPYTLLGTAIRVYDGDTFILQDEDGYHRIRLASIDAPELDQPYGQEARITLARMIQNKTVIVSVIDKDKYKREVGNVFCGESSDVSSYMLANGAAWHLSYFDRYHPKYELHAKLQLDAQKQGLGLWSQPKPVPPWVWRSRHTSK